MRADDIIDRLEKGNQLCNHGLGWWIGPSKRPYRRRIVFEVRDSLVDQMEKDGILEITIPYKSAFAKLKGVENG